MTWHKIWLVVRREYVFNFRRPSFLFTAFGVPLLSLVAMFFVFQFAVDRQTNLDDWGRIAYIDRAGMVRAEVANLNDYIPFSDAALARPDDPAALPAYFDALEAAAGEAVRAGDLDAYLIIPDAYVLNGQVELFAKKDIPDALREDIVSFMSAQVAARAPQALPVPATILVDPAITLRDVESGDELSEAEIVGRIMLPFVFVMIYFMATSTTAQFLMSGVVEEKENRLMEILATSLRPLELLWGKVLGLGALSLTQVGLWLGAGVLIGLLNANAREFLTSVAFTPGDLVLLAVLFVINFFLFSATMLALGAAVTAETESRQYAGIFTLVAVLPLMLVSLYFLNPNGAVPVVLTFFPYTGAVSLVLRMGLTTVPAWQMVASVTVQAVSVVGVMWLAAKVFRLGMLMYGKRLTPRAVWQAVREGRQVMTTASTYDDAGAPASTRQQKKGWLRR